MPAPPKTKKKSPKRNASASRETPQAATKLAAVENEFAQNTKKVKWGFQWKKVWGVAGTFLVALSVRSLGELSTELIAS